MKKLVAVLQKKVSREEMVSKLEEILLPLASILNNDMPIYQGFPLKSISIKTDEEAFMISFNGQTLALINLKHSQFSVFHSPKYDLTVEEHAVISPSLVRVTKNTSKQCNRKCTKVISFYIY